MTTDRPNLVPGKPYRMPGGGNNNWLNPAAFTPQAAGTPGNERNGALYGPHTRRADMSIFKNFNVTEKVSAQFRAEVYNISNTPNFQPPGSGISGWLNGPEHTAATPISKVGLLPGDVPAVGIGTQTDPLTGQQVSGGGFGAIGSTVPNINPRQFQFALKFQF